MFTLPFVEINLDHIQLSIWCCVEWRVLCSRGSGVTSSAPHRSQLGRTAARRSRGDRTITTLLLFQIYLLQTMYYLIRVPERVFISFILFHFVLLTTSLFYVIFWFTKAEKSASLPGFK